jgi:DNA-binding transcriptional LysR family regulator|tara:strand:- start:5022 stop:5417 length:396 start_codon:yes stop_codon:yes gene_type:complete
MASPAYLEAQGHPQTVSDLADHRLIGFTGPDSLNYWHLAEGVRVKPQLAASSGEAVRQLCLRGNDLAYLSHFVVAEDFARGDLVTVMDALIVRPSPREAVSAVYYRNSGIALRIQVLMDFFAPRFGLVGCQ